MVEQRQLTDEMVRQFCEGCELLKVMTPQERDEAEGLVNLSEFLTLLRLRAERTTP